MAKINTSNKLQHSVSPELGQVVPMPTTATADQYGSNQAEQLESLRKVGLGIFSEWDKIQHEDAQAEQIEKQNDLKPQIAEIEANLLANIRTEEDARNYARNLEIEINKLYNKMPTSGRRGAWWKKHNREGFIQGFIDRAVYEGRDKQIQLREISNQKVDRNIRNDTQYLVGEQAYDVDGTGTDNIEMIKNGVVVSYANQGIDILADPDRLDAVMRSIVIDRLNNFMGFYEPEDLVNIQNYYDYAVENNMLDGESRAKIQEFIRDKITVDTANNYGQIMFDNGFTLKEAQWWLKSSEENGMTSLLANATLDSFKAIRQEFINAQAEIDNNTTAEILEKQHKDLELTWDDVKNTPEVLAMSLSERQNLRSIMQKVTASRISAKNTAAKKAQDNYVQTIINDNDSLDYYAQFPGKLRNLQQEEPYKSRPELWAKLKNAVDSRKTSLTTAQNQFAKRFAQSMINKIQGVDDGVPQPLSDEQIKSSRNMLKNHQDELNRIFTANKNLIAKNEKEQKAEDTKKRNDSVQKLINNNDVLDYLGQFPGKLEALQQEEPYKSYPKLWTNLKNAVDSRKTSLTTAQNQFAKSHSQKVINKINGVANGKPQPLSREERQGMEYLYENRPDKLDLILSADNKVKADIKKKQEADYKVKVIKEYADMFSDNYDQYESILGKIQTAVKNNEVDINNPEEMRRLGENLKAIEIKEYWKNRHEQYVTAQKEAKISNGETETRNIIVGDFVNNGYIDPDDMKEKNDEISLRMGRVSLNITTFNQSAIIKVLSPYHEKGSMDSLLETYNKEKNPHLKMKFTKLGKSILTDEVYRLVAKASNSKNEKTHALQFVDETIKKAINADAYYFFKAALQSLEKQKVPLTNIFEMKEVDSDTITYAEHMTAVRNKPENKESGMGEISDTTEWLNQNAIRKYYGLKRIPFLRDEEGEYVIDNLKGKSLLEQMRYLNGSYRYPDGTVKVFGPFVNTNPDSKHIFNIPQDITNFLLSNNEKIKKKFTGKK